MSKALALRNTCIRAAHNGKNATEIAEKYDMTKRQVLHVLSTKPCQELPFRRGHEQYISKTFYGVPCAGSVVYVATDNRPDGDCTSCRHNPDAPQQTAAQPKKLLTPDEVRSEFKRAGINVSAWAQLNGFNRNTVVDVLRGQRKGLYGEAHRVAVALGLKAGDIVAAENFYPLPAAQRAA